MPYDTVYCVCDKCQNYSERYLTIDGSYQFIDVIRNCVLRFKFANCTDYAQTMGVIMAAQLIIRFDKSDFDCIIPMPIGPKRLKKRGYNQAELLAKIMSDELGIPLDKTTLVRIKESVPQSTLSAEERRKNLKGAFEVTSSLEGKRVLLVDDVRTTGASIDEASAVLLKKAKAKSVKGWTFAETD